jgi:DnaK suppressor protein
MKDSTKGKYRDEMEIKGVSMSIDVERFKNLFENILENYQSTKLDVDQNTATGDTADRYSAERDNLLLFKLQGRDSFYIKKVKDALQRIADGTFGECQECGEMISKARLNARPVATRCLCCKEEQERGEGHVPYQRRSHTHGQTLVNNVAKLPIQDEEIMKEKLLSFNKQRTELDATAL